MSSKEAPRRDEASSRRKLALAEDWARKLARRGPDRTVLLIGSLARGAATNDSDIDLAAIASYRRAPRPVSYQENPLAPVGVEFFSLGFFHRLLAHPYLPENQLRDMGRLYAGVRLAGSRANASLVRTAAAAALLRPSASARTFAVARTALHQALSLAGGGVGAARERLWLAQTSALAASQLSLFLTPERFQKPKWIVAGLRQAKDRSLLDLTRNLCVEPLASQAPLASTLDRMVRLIRQIGAAVALIVALRLALTFFEATRPEDARRFQTKSRALFRPGPGARIRTDLAQLSAILQQLQFEYQRAYARVAR